MKKITLLISILTFSICAISAQNLSIDGKFEFAGLKSSQLVPSFAKEISETTTIQYGEHPRKDAVYFYTGNVVTVVSPAQLNEYFETVYHAAVEASDSHKLFEPGSFGDTHLLGEITEPVKVEKSFGTFTCCFKHDGVWYRLTVSHKVQYDKFVKTYPEKYYGVKVHVQEYNVEEDPGTEY